MTQDQVIAAAREAGLTTGDNQWHNGVYWWRSLGRPTNVSTTDLERFYAIAYRQGMERAAEICDAKHAVRARDGFPREASTARALGSAIRAEAHAKNQPESTHDTGNV